jgi:hypothetical protein
MMMRSPIHRLAKPDGYEQSFLNPGVGRVRLAKRRQFEFGMTVQKGIWGEPPSRRYDDLAARFRSVVEEITGTRGLPCGAEGIRTSDLRVAGTRSRGGTAFRLCKAE